MPSDPELRAAVDSAVRHHLAGRTVPRQPSDIQPPMPQHPSHARFLEVPGGDRATPFLIEPAVVCVGCCYCQSYGH